MSGWFNIFFVAQKKYLKWAFCAKGSGSLFRWKLSENPKNLQCFKWGNLGTAIEKKSPGLKMVFPIETWICNSIAFFSLPESFQLDLWLFGGWKKMLKIFSLNCWWKMVMLLPWVGNKLSPETAPLATAPFHPAHFHPPGPQGVSLPSDWNAHFWPKNTIAPISKRKFHLPTMDVQGIC